MFSIPRFNGLGEPGGSEKDGARLDPRIAKLNQRKAQQKLDEQRQIEQSLAAASAAAPATASTAASAGLNIHPSRLAASHVLRHADRKARSSANGTAKEKTKAKQRYLNRKKDRRKKRKVAAVASAPKKKKREDQSGDNLERAEGDAEVEQKAGSSSDSSSSDDDSSDSDEEVQKERHIETLADDKADVDEDSMDVDQDGDQMADVERPDEEVEPTTHSPPAALMRLPAPRTTSQASRRDLAAQGLPQGLAHPTLVDATQTATVVSKDAHRPLDRVSEETKARLDKLGIDEWFAVQTAIIPALLDHPMAFDLYPTPCPGDLCVSSPTGSGKTLSYVVPIVEVLQKRICKRVRALVLLPTRELVHQVRETFEALTKGTHLTIASLTGQQSFAHEQSMLVDAPEVLLRSSVPGVRMPTRGSEEERRLIEYQIQAAYGNQEASSTTQTRRKAIESKVDIVIATPGRLIDHMEQTPGFTLQHLRFLVIDEADRLLSQSFQEWLPRILQALDPHQEPNERMSVYDDDAALHPAWLREKRLRQLTADASSAERAVVEASNWKSHSTQKLLFSATLTRDPAKIVALELRDATFISVEDGEKKSMGDNENADWQDSFALPSTLTEHMLVTTTSTKPLYLLHLLYTYEQPLRHTLCFTKSVESAARLVKLLEFFDEEWRKTASPGKSAGLTIRQHSSDLRPAQRTQLLKDVNDGKVDVVVCSDVIARGVDVDDVRNVISYDAPVEMAKYVHRVGRTARAGRQGDAWTLVEEQEARHFTHMIRRAGRWEQMDKVRLSKEVRHRLKASEEDPATTASDNDRIPFDRLLAVYQVALAKLEQHFSHSSSAMARRQRA